MVAGIRQLDESHTLTNQQKIILVIASIHGMLEFFDQFIVAFVLIFVMKPWHLTYGESAIVLLSSGIGAIIGAIVWGYIADQFGRRPALVAIVMTYSLSSLLLTFTPVGNWIYFAIFRVGVGLGVGGYIVNITLVQECAPARNRGWASGVISVCAPAGLLLSAACAAFLTPIIGWRGLFILGALPAFFVIVVLIFVPESPRWALRHGRPDLARVSCARLLGISPETVDLVPPEQIEVRTPKWTEIFIYRRSVTIGLLINLGVITGIYGLILWSPALLVMVERISPHTASEVMIAISLTNILGRVVFSCLSEKVGRRASGAISCFGGAILLVFTGWVAQGEVGLSSFFWLFLLVTFFLVDGGVAVSGPYTTEIWPSSLRASGSGFAYGVGSIGKITGPLGLALLIGASNYIQPEATVASIVPAFLYLSFWYVVAGLAYLFMGFETKGYSLEQIEQSLEETPTSPTQTKEEFVAALNAGKSRSVGKV
jgi:putative MFS transporter